MPVVTLFPTYTPIVPPSQATSAGAITPFEVCQPLCETWITVLLVQADQLVCSSAPAVLDRGLPQSKQPGLVFEPGPAGTWDESAIGNPVVSVLNMPLFKLFRTEASMQLTESTISVHQRHV